MLHAALDDDRGRAVEPAKVSLRRLDLVCGARDTICGALETGGRTSEQTGRKYRGCNPVPEDPRRAGRSAAGASIGARGLPAVYADGRLESAAGDLRRYRMAVLPKGPGSDAGRLNREGHRGRSGRPNPTRIFRPDLALLHHPAHSLDLCRNE